MPHARSFDEVTAIAPADGRDASGRYAMAIDPEWTIGGRPNGGYLLATLARAARSALAVAEGPDHPHPVTATAHYLTSPGPGPAEVHTEVLRRGRWMSQVRARLERGGSPAVEAVFTLGRHDVEAEPWWTDLEPPPLPPMDECVRAQGVGPGGVELAIMNQVHVRLDPATAGFTLERPSGIAEVRGWLAFGDGREPDPLALLYAADAFPPATLELATLGWVPTLELTVYVRGVPAPGPLMVSQRARLVQADLVDEVCHVWDSRGRLVAQATQLAGVRVGGASRPPSDKAGPA
jgi:Acyl-CoA thioesterase C-terminal domain/Acyl-CoA thioesterase N-terminal domain